MNYTAEEIEAMKLTHEDKVRVAERYWLAMRRDLHLAAEREQKAFEAFQELVRSK